jgi:hypothetical protein
MSAPVAWPSEWAPSMKAEMNTWHEADQRAKAAKVEPRHSPAARVDDGRLAALEARLAAVEEFLGPGPGRDLLDVIGSAVGETVGDIRHLVKDLPTAIHRNQAVSDAMAKEILTKQAQELGLFSYRGVWRGPVDYDKGAVVTHDGSLWLALAPSSAVRPNSSPAVWRMITKRGGGF